MSLSEKELRFCREYAANPNATEAYLRAFRGCSYVTARSRSYRLLQRAAIQAELAEARKAYAKRARVSAVKVLKELAGIAHLDPDDVFEACSENNELPCPRPWREIPPQARKAIQRIKIKRKRLSAGPRKKDEKTCWEIEEVDYQFHSKDAALDKLCKHLGITKDGAALEELLKLLAEGAEGDSASPPAVGEESGDCTPPGADSPPPSGDGGGSGPDSVPG